MKDIFGFCCYRFMVLLLFQIICNTTISQIKVPRFPNDKAFLYNLFESNTVNIKQIKLTHGIKYPGEAVKNLPENWEYNYGQNGKLLSFLKTDGATKTLTRYLYLSNKKYREIKSIADMHVVKHFDYTEKGVRETSYRSMYEGAILVEIMANTSEKVLRDEMLELNYGQKSVQYFLHDFVYDHSYRQRIDYHKGNPALCHRIDVRNQEYETMVQWNYKYDDLNRISEAIHVKSKILQDRYVYEYDGGNLSSIVRKIDDVEIDRMDFFYNNKGLITSCLLSSKKNSKLDLYRFSYTFY